MSREAPNRLDHRDFGLLVTDWWRESPRDAPVEYEPAVFKFLALIRYGNHPGVKRIAEANMTTTELDAIEATVLQLPQTDRAHLVERLLASLEDDDEILAAWIAEAEKRADALASGNTTWLPIDQAMLKARAGLVR